MKIISSWNSSEYEWTYYSFEDISAFRATEATHTFAFEYFDRLSNQKVTFVIDTLESFIMERLISTYVHFLVKFAEADKKTGDASSRSPWVAAAEVSVAATLALFLAS